MRTLKVKVGDDFVTRDGIFEVIRVFGNKDCFCEVAERFGKEAEDGSIIEDEFVYENNKYWTADEVKRAYHEDTGRVVDCVEEEE